jgi:mannose-6-phosphate isomerase-like protein (cupin superfamily)
MRRVVTGHTPDGQAIVVSDTEVDAIVPGGNIYMIWGVDETPTLPDDGSPRPYSTFFPPVGGVRFSMMTVPPVSNTPVANTKVAEIRRELDKRFPDFSKYFKNDKPGMHQTDSIDFVYIISGEVWMELDDGKEVHLKAGDTLVQNGTIHGWRNKGTETCKFIGCLIGASRK